MYITQSQLPCCPSYRQIFGLFLAVFLFFVVSQLSPTLYIRFYPDTTIEFTCFLFCTVFLSITVPLVPVSYSSAAQFAVLAHFLRFPRSLCTLHTLSLSLCSHVHHFVPVLYIKKEQQTNKQTNLFSHVLFHCHLFLRAYLVYNKYSRVAPPAQPHQQQHHHQQQIEKNKNNNNSVTDQQQQSQPPTTFRIFIVSFSSFGHF